FLGNNTGRGIPEQWTLLPSAGYACLVMDNRGQTGPASPGATPHTATAGPHVVGRVTLGIESPETCYSRPLFADAVGAVRAPRAPRAWTVRWSRCPCCATRGAVSSSRARGR